MKFSKFLTAVAMVSLVTAPVAAQASESLPVRSASPQDGENIAGVSTLLLIIGALVVIGVIVLIADDNNNNPASP